MLPLKVEEKQTSLPKPRQGSGMNALIVMELNFGLRIAY
jgi:hypothetical protein